MSRRFNIVVTIVISAIFLGLTAIFWQSYVRFGEACRDFGLSVAYYFCELIGIDYSFTPTVTEYSGVLQWEILLPSDWDGFTVSAKQYFALLIDGENFVSYWSAVGNVMLIVAKIIAILLPCVLVLWLVLWRMYRHGNTDHNRDTVIEVVCKKAHDDTCRVQVEHPKDDPAYPNRPMLRKIVTVGKYSAFYRLICFACDCLENAQRTHSRQ